MIRLAYFMKGKGFVRAAYHPNFRAYSYCVKGITYLSMGPGWAYHFDYLSRLLDDTFSYYYKPDIGDCVIDIGAGLGEESVIYALKVGPTGKVYSIEANATSYAAIEFMAETNKFTWLKPLHLAIYSENTTVNIEDDDKNYVKNTIHADRRSGMMVKALTLDSVIQQFQIGKIDFLKVNIEGAEKFLIQGMTDSLNKIRNLCIACHDFRHTFHGDGAYYVTKDIVKSYLENNGFEIMIRNTGNRVTDDYVYARNLNFKE